MSFGRSMIRHLFLAAAAATGARAQFPPPPVLSPEQSQAAFELAEPGYRIELVACEPMVQDPVVIQFDGDGRLWVVEMRGFMEDLEKGSVKEPIGRVSVLEDTDGDGLMDKSTVFLDQLVLPRAIAVLPHGVLVAENKPLWFAQDTNGDLVADRKTLVDANYARDSVEHSANGLLRAIDNRIYNAKEGHRYRRQGDEWIREPTEERGQWGIAQDDWGRLFYNYNHSQLHFDVAPPGSFTRNPNHEPTTGLSVGVTTTNAVFPIRPNPATNRGYISGALDGQGRIQEFTSACAPFIYRGASMPGLRGNSFVCDPAGNLIKRSVLSDSGLHVFGAPAHAERDFLTSQDERFRPCWITSGPDDALYLADMYRGIVQDGPHMSPYLREHSAERKMDRPIHLGRIWRIVPEVFEQPPRPSLSQMNAAELTGLLEHSSGWWRDQTQMHLVDRQLRDALPELRRMALEHSNPIARLHALWTLEGLGDSEPEQLLPALDDPDPFVHSAAIRILHKLQIPNGTLAQWIARHCDHPASDRARFQMILTLGDLQMPDGERVDSLGALLMPVVADPLMRDAALSSLAQRERAFLDHLWPTMGEETLGLPFLIELLAQAITRSRDSDDIAALLNKIDTPNPDWRHAAILAAVRLHRAELSEEPVELPSSPKAAEIYPDLKVLFAWPGHTPPPPTQSPVRKLTPTEQTLFVRGRQIFLTNCVACHGADGKGIHFLAPPLAGSDWVDGSPQRLARVLFHGLTGPITVSGKEYTAPEIQPVMPPLAALGNDEIAAVLTYIRREWGNTAEPVSPRDISDYRIEAQGRTMPWTEAELASFAEANEPADADGS